MKLKYLYYCLLIFNKIIKLKLSFNKFNLFIIYNSGITKKLKNNRITKILILLLKIFQFHLMFIENILSLKSIFI